MTTKKKATEVGKGDSTIQKVKEYTKAKKQSLENEEQTVIKKHKEFQDWLKKGTIYSPGEVHVGTKVSGIPPLVALKKKLGSLKTLVTGDGATKKEIEKIKTKHGFYLAPNNLKLKTKDREIGGDVVVKVSKDKTKKKPDKKPAKIASAYMSDYNNYEYGNDYYNNEYLNDYYNNEYLNDYNMDYSDQYMENGQYYANNYYVPQSYINSDYKVNAEMITLGVIGIVFACFMMVIVGCICTGIGLLIVKNMKQNVNVKVKQYREQIEEEEEEEFNMDEDNNRQEQQLLV